MECCGTKSIGLCKSKRLGEHEKNMMNPETERLRELGSLIRAGHAELGTLQLQLMDAHERRFNPALLGVRIADLGREIAAWKREQKILFRHIAPEPDPSLACSSILEGLPDQLDQTMRVRRTEKRNFAPKGSRTRKQVVV